MNTMKKFALALSVLVVFLLLPRMAVAPLVPDGAAVLVEVIGSDETQILGPLSATYWQDEGERYWWLQTVGTITTSVSDVWANITYTFNVVFEGNLNLSAIVTAYGNVNRTMMTYNWSSGAWKYLIDLPEREWTNVTFTLPSSDFVAANGTCLVMFRCVGYWYVPCAILVDYINIGLRQEVPPAEITTITPNPLPDLESADNLTSVLQVIVGVMVESIRLITRLFLFWLV